MAGTRDSLDGTAVSPESGAQSWSLEDLLGEGERVEVSVAMTDDDSGGGRVVVTDRRVLALTPRGEAGNFRQVDRPNVTGVRAGTAAADTLRSRALLLGLFAVASLAVGFAVDFAALVPQIDLDTSGGEQLGLGGALAVIARALELLARLDDALRVVGALALAATVVLLGVYALSRQRVVVVGVAGDDDVRVPVAADRRAAVVDELDAALSGPRE